VYVRELTTRKYRGKQTVEIRGPEDVFQFLKGRFQNLDREHFLIVLLSARNTVIGIETISVGSLNASIVHPREVYKPAIAQSAASLILAHNHPSGMTDPSDDDLALTRRLQQVGELVGIPVTDHLICAGSSFYSLKQQGHLP
jgi:DNA repair protein RadC